MKISWFSSCGKDTVSETNCYLKFLKGHNSKIIQTRVMGLVLCLSSSDV